MTEEKTKEIICHGCQEPGHTRRAHMNGSKNVIGRKAQSGGDSGAWCSAHRNSLHSYEGCYRRERRCQRRPRSRPSGCAHCPHSSAKKKGPSAQDGAFDSTVNHKDYDGGLSFSANSCPGQFVPNSGDATLLTDSGATETFLDDQLFPGIKDRIKEHTDLKKSKSIVTAGGHELQGTGTGVISCVARDEEGNRRPARLQGKTLPDLDATSTHPHHSCRTESSLSSRPETHT